MGLPDGQQRARSPAFGKRTTKVPHPKRTIPAIAASAILLAAPGRAIAQEAPPLFEVDAIAIGALTPDYPGSSQMHAHFLPLPWITYRGDFLRTDEAGSVRGRIIDTNRVGLDVSINGSFPADSQHNDARDGMADLDWMGEIGPKLRVTGYQWGNDATGRRARMLFELPVRAVFSTDLSTIDYRGVLTQPSLAWEARSTNGAGFKLSVGPMFATHQLTEYFYGVDPADARANRPAYTAQAGYMGTRVGLKGTQPIGDRLRLIAAADYDYLGGAANEDSPLLKETSNISVRMGLVVSLYRSQARASLPAQPSPSPLAPPSR